jgi:hypothetical protein
LVLSYLPYVAYSYDGIETEVMQSHFAQLRNIRPIHVGSSMGSRFTLSWRLAQRPNGICERPRGPRFAFLAKTFPAIHMLV